MDTISPNIFVRDINETIKFYGHLGFQVVMKVPEQGDIAWAMMTCGNVNFMFQSFESLGDDNHEYGSRLEDRHNQPEQGNNKDDDAILRQGHVPF